MTDTQTTARSLAVTFLNLPVTEQERILRGLGIPLATGTSHIEAVTAALSMLREQGRVDELAAALGLASPPAPVPQGDSGPLACPQGRTDYEACFAPFRYCPVEGCGRTEGGGQMPTDATQTPAGTGTWRDKVALAEMRDYVTRMTPLVEAIKYEWGPINGGWRLDDDTLSELAWEAAHAVDHWLRQGEGPSHVPMVMFRNEIALREGWRDRALAAGYEPDATWSGEHRDG